MSDALPVGDKLCPHANGQWAKNICTPARPVANGDSAETNRISSGTNPTGAWIHFRCEFYCAHTKVACALSRATNPLDCHGVSGARKVPVHGQTLFNYSLSTAKLIPVNMSFLITTTECSLRNNGKSKMTSISSVYAINHVYTPWRCVEVRVVQNGRLKISTNTHSCLRVVARACVCVRARESAVCVFREMWEMLWFQG